MTNAQFVDRFNAQFRPGETVQYRDDAGKKTEHVLNRSCQLLSGHTPVVWISGKPGCVHAKRISKAERTEVSS